MKRKSDAPQFFNRSASKKRMMSRNQLKSTLLLIRHGVTVWNDEGRFQGWAATRLKQEGRDQARKIGEYIAKAFQPHMILSSDLPRARETAEIIRTALPSKQRIILDKGLREFHAGIFQGLTHEEIKDALKYYPEHAKEGLGKKHAIPEGESAPEFMTRVWEKINDIARNNHGIVLVVTHGGVIKMTLGKIKGMSPKEIIDEPSVKNGSITIIEYDHETGVYEIVRENDTSFF